MKKSLTFKNDKFILSGTIPLGDYWSHHNSVWVTTNLKAAAVFREIADDKAEETFSNAFIKRYPLPDRSLPSFLDKHQVSGVKWILTRSACYLAHAPGAGKTCQAIVAADLSPYLGKVVFIVPPGLTYNWKKEIEKFTGFKKCPPIAIIKTTKEKSKVNWDAHYIIIPDSMLTKYWVCVGLRKLKIKFLAVDEASRFKTYSTSRSLMLYNSLIGRAHHTVFMDGSPMPNRPMELWAPAYALNPEAIDCMDQTEFGFKYCGPTCNDYGQWVFNGSSREKELKERLQKDFMHVVTEDELTHPERLRSILFTSTDLRSPAHKAFEKKNLTKMFSLDEDDSTGEMARYRAELGNRKVPFIAQYVRERLENKNESILLFVWHREVARRLASELHEFKPGVIIGGTLEREREKVFGAFQSGSCKLIIGNIHAMGRGHNLQRADRVIFGECSWSDETNKQCEKRASRRGSKKVSVRCEYICSPNSMDELVLNSIFTKEKRTKAVIG